MSNNPTSAFQTDLDEQKSISYPSKWTLILQLLEDLKDGSKQSFLDALSNPEISAPAIAKTLKNITNVEINRSTITEWRKRNERISEASQ